MVVCNTEWKECATLTVEIYLEDGTLEEEEVCFTETRISEKGEQELQSMCSKANSFRINDNGRDELKAIILEQRNLERVRDNGGRQNPCNQQCYMLGRLRG